MPSIAHTVSLPFILRFCSKNLRKVSYLGLRFGSKNSAISDLRNLPVLQVWPGAESIGVCGLEGGLGFRFRV